MLDPCNPCVCPGAPCEQCVFGYRSKEDNHKNMKDLIIAVEKGEKPLGWRCVETYKNFHRDWKKELPELESPVVEIQNNIYDKIMEARLLALKEGIVANSIVINKNMVKVPSYDIFPDMICGLDVYWTSKELPDNYSFAVLHNPNSRDNKLAQYESIGMSPDELKKAADFYRKVKEMVE